MPRKGHAPEPRRDGSGPLHDLHIVSGKGGTGKTTIAAGLACALATKGRRVLLCEVEGRHGIAELFDVPALQAAEERRLCRTPAGGQVFGLSINADDALMEYLRKFYHLGVAGKAMERFGIFDFATSIAPGLRDVLLTGKIYEATGRKLDDEPNAYDAVVLDAPPTGRIAKFLNVHEAVTGLARMGPIHNQAGSIMRMFRSDTTVVHLVTLLEEMPVTETIEATRELMPTEIEVGTVICNRVQPSDLTDEQVVQAAAGTLAVTVPGLSKEQHHALCEELAVDAGWLQQQRECRAMLDELDVTLVGVGEETNGIDLASLFHIGDVLAAQLPKEVRK